MQGLALADHGSRPGPGNLAYAGDGRLPAIAKLVAKSGDVAESHLAEWRQKDASLSVNTAAAMFRARAPPDISL